MLNIKKNSLFERYDAGREDIKEGVLAVWGSPGSGKTTVSVKLAKYLSDNKRDVMLIFCDMTAPMLPCVCPESEMEEKTSLGSILAATHSSPGLIRNHCVTMKRNNYLTMLGLQKGENEYTYPPHSVAQVSELIKNVRSMAPYVIIDCSSYIANDILSAVSLMEADAVLRLVNCDLKSISYLSSQLPLLKDTKWDADKQYKVASNVKSYESGIRQVLGSVSFQIPHSMEVVEQSLSGNLFADLTGKESRGVRKEISKIAGEVFGC